MKSILMAAFTLAPITLFSVACSEGSSGSPIDGGVDAEITDAKADAVQDVSSDVQTDAPCTGFRDGLTGTDIKMTIDGVQNEKCTAATACGGNIEGAWKFSKACTTANYNSVLSKCPGATIDKMDATLNGVLQAACNKLKQESTTVVNATATIPKFCAQQVGGCAGFQAVIQSQIPGSKATCKDKPNSSSNCECEVVSTQKRADIAGYTISGNSITTESGETFDYCVKGDTLTFTNSGGGAVFPGVFELTNIPK